MAKQAPYYDIAGERYPRVTSILKTLNKPLLGWAAKLAAERAMPYILGHVPAPTFQSDDDIESFRKHLSAAYRDGGAREHGTRVHELIEAFVSGGEPEPRNQDEADQLAKYVSWQQEAGFTPVVSELRLVNPEVGYAGTVDLIGFGPSGVVTILDVKTGGVWSDHALQLAAYRYATHWHDQESDEMHQMDSIFESWWDWHPDESSTLAAVLRVPTDEDVSLHYVADLPWCMGVFESLLEVHRWDKDRDQKFIERKLL